MVRQSGTDYSLSIEELTGAFWGEPRPNDTPLVREVYALVKKPIDSLNGSDLLTAVGQAVGVPYILDIAFARLRDDPLFCADCYPGDILSNLIRADDSIWAERPLLKQELRDLYGRAMKRPVAERASFLESLGLTPGSDQPH